MPSLMQAKSSSFFMIKESIWWNYAKIQASNNLKGSPK
jgi:hypothetical protein